MKTYLLFFTTLLICTKSLFANSKTEVINSSLSEHFSQEFDFEIVKGMIYVKAVVDGVKGNYILDTGAPDMILNTRNTSPKKVLACGISGQMEARWTTIKNFEWASIKKKKMPAMALDLKHLEQITETSISGIIGYEFLKNYILFLDYKNRFGRLEKNSKSQIETPLLVIPFKMQEHLPIVKTKIGNKTYFLGLDTGAGVNVLNKCRIKKLKIEDYSKPHRIYLTGLSSQIARNTSLTVHRTVIKKETFQNMRFVLADINHFNDFDDLLVDGFLGYPFLKHGSLTINYKKRKIYIWDYSEGELTAARE